MTSRLMLRPTSKASEKRNLHSASRHGQEKWQNASNPMTNTLKGTIRDHTRIVLCVSQSGHGMICD